MYDHKAFPYIFRMRIPTTTTSAEAAALFCTCCVSLQFVNTRSSRSTPVVSDQRVGQPTSQSVSQSVIEELRTREKNKQNLPTRFHLLLDGRRRQQQQQQN